MTAPRRGLTLVEIMIAVALSTVIILCGFAGVRSAAQTVSFCNRMSAENAAFRAGFVAAIDDLDYWRSTDEPTGATGLSVVTTDLSTTYLSNQQNRAAGLPFAQLDLRSGGSVLNGNRFWKWKQSDPFTWTRVDLCCNTLSLGGFPLLAGNGPNIVRIGHPDGGARRWHPEVIQHVRTQGGVYALMDLLQPDTYFMYYGTWPEAQLGIAHNNASLRAISFTFNHPDVFGAGDISRLTGRNIDGVALSSNPAFAATMATSQFGMNSQASATNLLNRSSHTTLLNPSRAASQMAITIVTRHAWFAQRNWGFCQVNVFNPSTGSDLALSFNCLGTTLRGARQQRDAGLDGAVAPAAASRLNLSD